MTNNEAFFGGGVCSGLSGSPSAVIRESVISQNNARNFGGGLFVQNSALTLENVRITQNVAGSTGGLGSGGGLWYSDLNTSPWAAPLRVFGGTVVSGNSASQNGGGLSIYTVLSFEISDITVSGNSALNGRGGGVRLIGFGTVTSSTFSGNSAFIGGGIATSSPSRSSQSTVAISCSTMFDNDATVSGSGLFAEGNSQVTYQGSIIVNNPATAINCALQSIAVFTSLGYNLFVTESSCPTTTTDVVVASVAEVMLGPLQDPTHALLEGSPAVNAGDTCPKNAFDQRGLPRPARGANDIGSLELQEVV